MDYRSEASWRAKSWMRNMLYLIGFTIASPWLVWRWLERWTSLRNGWRSRFQQKFLGLSGPCYAAKDATQLIWLHGVSVGEVQLLAEFKKRLSVEYPHARFVLSTTTTSGMEVAKKLSGDAECFYFPFDFSWAIQRVFDRLQPDLLILGELEMWPNLIDVAAGSQVPLVVVNGRLSEGSFRGYRRFSWLTQPMFRKLTHVAAQTEEYAERFRVCGCRADRVSVTGNLKFDNVAFDGGHEQVQRLRELVGLDSKNYAELVDSRSLKAAGVDAEEGRRNQRQASAAGEGYRKVPEPRSRSRQLASQPSTNKAHATFQRDSNSTARLLVLGSSQEPEERATVDAFMELRATYEHMKLVVVPRHPDRFAEVAEWLEAIPLQVQRRSRLQAPLSSGMWDILLVDTVGELRWWWGLAEIAIVGGSFGDRGGQNMIEPSAYGANVAFGPNTSNFRDVTQLLLQGNAATRLSGTDAILPWLRSELQNPDLGKQRGYLARQLITEQQGATRRTIEILRRELSTGGRGKSLGKNFAA